MLGCSQATYPTTSPITASQPRMATHLGPGMYLRHNALLARFLPPHHGVGLPGSRLPVGKDAHVVAFEGVEQHLFANVSVHLLLRRELRVLRLGEMETEKVSTVSWCFASVA